MRDILQISSPIRQSLLGSSQSKLNSFLHENLIHIPNFRRFFLVQQWVRDFLYEWTLVDLGMVVHHERLGETEMDASVERRARAVQKSSPLARFTPFRGELFKTFRVENVVGVCCSNAKYVRGRWCMNVSIRCGSCREEFVVALCRERRVPSSNLSNVEEEFK
jgi:hypothetical protein